LLTIWMTCLCLFAPQDPVAAVAVRGDAELSPAAALASARTKVDEHLRALWRERAERLVAAQRPFWVPQPIAEQTVRRWLAELPTSRLARVVDREDRQRAHAFGDSWQTTLWVAEDGREEQQLAARLSSELRAAERATALKYAGIAVGWALLVLACGWLDRLSRGYMTGRLVVAGLLLGLLVPATLFLV
jgi:hypothetical protein